MRQQIVQLHEQGLSYDQIIEVVGCSKSTISYHIKAHRNGKPIMPNAAKRYDWKSVQAYYDECGSVKQTCEHFGFDKSTFYNATTKKKVYLTHPFTAQPLNEVMVENSTYTRRHLKKRLIDDGLLENKCDECGQLPEWQSKSLVMVLDHKNGVNNDNRLDNLRLLCPNCNSQTDTFAGRNVKKKKYSLVD